MIGRILRAIGRAIKALGKGAWAALEDLYEQPGLALARTIDTARSIGSAALGAVEWTANTLGAIAPKVSLGGGGYIPPEPPSERLQRPYSQDILTRKVPGFEPDMSPSWYAAYAYIVGGRAMELPGVAEDFAALARIAPDVQKWAISLSEVESDMVKRAGGDAMMAHLRGQKTIEGVRPLGRRRVPDGILDTPAPKRGIAFELADGYDLGAGAAPAL